MTHQPEIPFRSEGDVFYQLTPAELYEHMVVTGEGLIADNGAIVVDTGKFTGRAPKDRYIVKDETTADTVDWGDINIPMAPETFERLWDRVTAYLYDKDLYVRDAYVGAKPEYRLNVRVVSESPYHSLFTRHLFIVPSADELESFTPQWHIVAAPYFEVNPERDGTRSANFVAVNFTRRIVLVAGTGYAGELKKSMFSIMNYILPHEKGVLSMHCSANIGADGDTALFFGLSGTGKTTLSADPNRRLIGDDEHGWDADSVFNFEGGCYAKVIDLSPEKEPQIYHALRFETVLENVQFFPGTRTINFADASKTENTRAAYPLRFIDGAVIPSVGPAPKNIFFLTADAFGVLPPISRLTKAQAMFWFLSGYTAKVAGTEEGVTEPQPTFSACFGAPFLPLHPVKYAQLLGRKMEQHPVNIWLVNTGWTGGPYGVGHRFDLPYTRAMISAALEGKLDNVEYATDPVFGLHFPTTCPGVPDEVLNPRATWTDKAAYDAKARQLAQAFIDNFQRFADYADDEIRSALPKVGVAS